MRTRLVGTIAMAALTLGVTVGTARAQVLGLEVDLTQGFPGDVVNGQVNTDDVAANCNTTIELVQESFAEILAAFEDPVLIEQYFPGTGGDISNPQNYDQLAYFFTAITSLAVNFNILDASQLVLDQTFVMTFADIATQQPVGPRSNFDPNTGVGSIAVPDLTPGLWAVAATCIEPKVAQIPNTITAGAAFLEAEGIPVPLPPDFDLFGVLGQIAPSMLPPLMGPEAFGAALFTILAPSPIDLTDAVAWQTRAKPGKISLTGTLQTGVFGANDVLDASQGLTITVTDSLTMNQVVEVAAGDCSEKPSGRIVCRTADHKTTATFNPRPTPGQYRFKILMKNQDITGPQAGPLTLDLQYGIPRSGSNANCDPHPSKLDCRD